MNLIARITTGLALTVFSSLAFADVVSGAGSVPAQGSQTQKEGWSGMLGLAALSAPEYWGSDETEGTAAPIIIVDYNDTAYFKVNRGGYWFYKPNENLRVGALVKIRAGAWEDDDDSIEDLNLPSGFDEPDAQVEPGVNVLYRSGDFSAEVQLLAGEDTNIAVSFDFRAFKSERSTLTLRFSAEQLGEDTVNYNWYGDSSAADPDSATNTSVAVIGTYSLNPSWTLLYGLQTTTLDDEIEDSPIGDEDSYTVGFVGAGWSF